MYKPLTKSLIFHTVIAILLFASSWAIFSRHQKIPDEKPIVVTLQNVPLGEKTNVKPAPKHEVKPPTPQPKQEVKKPEPKKPEPKKPEPKKPEPKPEPKKPEPKKPEPKPEPKKEAKKEPEKKPKKQETAELDSLLKNLDDKPTPTKSSDEKNTDEKSKSDVPFDENAPIAQAELDYIKKLIVDQIKQCWSPPAGVINAKNLNVLVNVDISQDGTMKFAGFEDSGMGGGDPIYRAAADSAKRAVLDPACNPLRTLPPIAKYSIWKEMTLNFNPQDLIY